MMVKGGRHEESSLVIKRKKNEIEMPLMNLKKSLVESSSILRTDESFDETQTVDMAAGYAPMHTEIDD